MKTKNIEKRIERVEAIVPVVEKLVDNEEARKKRHNEINQTFSAFTEENNSLRNKLAMVEVEGTVTKTIVGDLKAAFIRLEDKLEAKLDENVKATKELGELWIAHHASKNATKAILLWAGKTLATTIAMIGTITGAILGVAHYFGKL